MSSLRKMIVSLKQLFKECYQYTRYNGIKLRKIPKQENEDVMAVVRKVSTVLNFPLKRIE